MTSHQAEPRYSRPWLSMLPQLGIGGCTPSPRKLSDDSTMISSASWKLETTSAGADHVGRDVPEEDTAAARPEGHAPP